MSDHDHEHAALYWNADDNGGVRCGLCPHRCLMAENSSGICGARANRGGALVASSYGAVSSIALDPIEKKPLYLFHPGKRILSIGGFGCNLRCRFCQNHEISTMRFDATPCDTAPCDTAPSHQIPRTPQTPRTPRTPQTPRTPLLHQPHRCMTPQDVAALAVRTVPDGNIGVAYTYNEPLIGYEFLCDCAALVREAGLRNVIVTNGYINKEPLEALLPLIDAMNIDLKGFTGSFYQKVGGALEPVKEAIELAAGRCHVEVTTLVIPGENEEDIEPIAKWLSSLDPGIPLHLSRFFPRHKYQDRAPTPRETIIRLVEIAKRHLKNVFAGNM